MVADTITLSNTFGAVLIGTFLGLPLYGMVVHQAYRYFRLYPEDHATQKSLVAFVLVLVTFHMVLSTHICYHYLVESFGAPESLMQAVWSLSLLAGISSLTVITTQSFFTRRVYLLGGRYRIVVFVVAVLMVGELGSFAAATVEAFLHPSREDFTRYTWLIAVGGGMVQVSDMLLTSALVVTLRKARTGVKRMDTVIDALIQYAMTTGLLTSVVNCTFLIFSLLFPSNLIYAAFGIVCTQLYANSLLAALNTRKSLTLRAMYDLEADWVDVPITPRSAFHAVTSGQGRSAPFDVNLLRIPVSTESSSLASSRMSRTVKDTGRSGSVVGPRRRSASN